MTATTHADATPPLDAMADRITDTIGSAVFAPRRADRQFQRTLAGFIHCAVTTIALLAAGPDQVIPAARAPEFGRWLAAQGYPVTAVRDSYWLALRLVLDHWATEVWTWPNSDGGEVPVDRFKQLTNAAFDFTERGVTHAVQAHEEATAEFRRAGDLRRRDCVLAILEAEDPPTPLEWETTLGYPLSAGHVCVLLKTPDRAQAEQTLRRAQTATGARNRLLVSLTPFTWTGWLGFAGPPEPDSMRMLHRTLKNSTQRTATGGPRRGVSGFRRAHDEARRADELRAVLVTEEHSLAFRDLALDSLLLHDIPAAKAFALDQLGELAEDTARAARIRETLLAYLSTGSQTMAAARLGIHLNSFRARLATVVKALGPGYLDCRAELLVALRITNALGRVL